MNKPALKFNGQVQGLLGWLSLLALGILGGCAAAASGSGLALGLPAVGVVLGVAAALLLLALLVARRAGAAATPALGLLVAPLALLLSPWFPGLRALSGPPLWALAAAGAVAALAVAGKPPRRRLFLPVVFLVYVAVAWHGQRQVGAEGDEPHYLMVADSLLQDHDLALEEDYAAGRYRAFYRGATLAPHYRIRGRGGEIYSLHAVGLSLLILPAYALGGYLGVSFFMALLAALLAREIRRLIVEWTGSASLGEGLAWALALCPPLIHYAGLVFTEVPAALLVACGLRRGRDLARLGGWGTAGWAASLAFLPWLNVRYAPLSAILALYGLARWPGFQRAGWLAGLAALSAAGLGLYHQALYGFFDPRLVYGRRPEFALSTLREGLPGLLLDQEFGLLAYGPVFALGLLALPRLFEWGRREAACCLALVAIVFLTAGSWHMWRGGFNPPARFLVPVLAPLAVAVATALRRGLWGGAALLLGFSLFAGLAGVADPRLVHRDRDGTAPFYRTWSGAEEWTRLLPGFVLDDSRRDRWALTLIWTVALASAAWPRRRPQLSATRLAVAVAGLAVASASASARSTARTGGREAVHVLGGSVLVLPSLQLVSKAGGEWGAQHLGWGPLYEPHRFPLGAEVGSRLQLAPGRYEIRLQAELLGPAAPALEVRPEPPQPVRLYRLAGGAEGLLGCFVVEAEDRAITPALSGGSPLVLKGVRLENSTLCEPSGLIRGKGATG
ncbi:MAG TPA: hypothetical protein VJU18_07935 [Vicinamibacteria bacterium]|nr:hypothetical protein [Vicinamibacteria bacterium]